MPSYRMLGPVLVGAMIWMLACAKGDLGDSSGSSPFGGVGPSASNGMDSGGQASTDATSEGDASGVGGEGCGDGVVEGPEQCDGDDLNGQTCTSQGFSGGQLGCTPSCIFDTSMCSDACGNDSIDAGEDCDGNALGGMGCDDVGFAGGTLGCTPECTFDTTGCADAVCGDGVVHRSEECDCGQMGGNCSAAQLGNQSCTTRTAPSGGNYSGGTLACNSPASCTFDDSACHYCGDGTIDEGEQCDGGNLGGATCQDEGYDAGTLSCNANCTFNVGSCVTWVCGNAVCDPNENECSCPADCPNNPNSCAPCQCGGNGGNCFCDQSCVSFGDCCPNGPC